MVENVSHCWIGRARKMLPLEDEGSADIVLGANRQPGVSPRPGQSPPGKRWRMWDYLSYRDFYRAGDWHLSHALSQGLMLRPDEGGSGLIDEEGLAGRDRQICRFCGRLWDPARWEVHAPDGWDGGICVPCRLIIEEFFV